MTNTEFKICNYCKKSIALDVREKLVSHTDQFGNHCTNVGSAMWHSTSERTTQVDPAMPKESGSEPLQTSASPES